MGEGGSPIPIHEEVGDVSVFDTFDVVLPYLVHAHNELGVMVADGVRSIMAALVS